MSIGMSSRFSMYSLIVNCLKCWKLLVLIVVIVSVVVMYMLVIFGNLKKFSMNVMLMNLVMMVSVLSRNRLIMLNVF